MAGVGEDDPSWERAITAAVKNARISPFSAPKTLTLFGAVKSSTGHLPSPALFDRFPSLEELSVAGARLSSLVGFPRLLALRRFSLPDNRLSGADSLAAVAESYGGTLRHLDLGNNRFAEVEALGLYQCPITKVKGYKENVCALIPSLKYLDGADAKGNERLETDEEEDGEEEGEGEGEMEDGEEAEGDAEDGEEGEGDEEEEGDEEAQDEDEENGPDADAEDESKVTNGSKESTGSALPNKRKRDDEDDANGDN